jgi:hypothetical protein
MVYGVNIFIVAGATVFIYFVRWQDKTGRCPWSWPRVAFGLAGWVMLAWTLNASLLEGGR